MNKMVYDPIACIMVPEITQDAGIKDPIQQRKHEIVVKTENYLRSIGKSNSVGKFDRVVQGVKNLLYQGYLEGPELERAIKQEADRLIKKYNLNDECPEGMTCDKDERTVDSAIKACDASGIHILFYRDIDGNKMAEKFTDIGKMRSRANELVNHGINKNKMKEWTHAEWAKEKYNEIYNKLMGQI